MMVDSTHIVQILKQDCMTEKNSGEIANCAQRTGKQARLNSTDEDRSQLKSEFFFGLKTKS